MLTAKPKPKRGFFIGVTCPGCGGTLELAENFFVLTCRYCGSALRITKPDIPPAYLIQSKVSGAEVRFHLDRYLKENSFPLSGSGLEIRPVYYPYWKVSAMVLKLRNRIEERELIPDETYDSYNTDMNNSKIRQRKTEIALTPFMTTFAAGQPRDDIPYSIGMRTEYIKMIPFAQENIEENFECLPVIKSWDDMQSNLTRNVDTVGKITQADFGKNKTELFNPNGSLVYFPYYMADISIGGKLHRIIIDGITGRVAIDNILTEIPEESPIVPKTPFEFGKLGVELHRCTNCGFDLPTKQSYIYICHNCRQLTLLEKHTLLQKSILSANMTDSGKSEQYFPFWALKLPQGSGRKLQILFGGIYQSDYLVIPAFRVANFEALHRLTKRISAGFAKMKFSEIDEFGANFMSVVYLA